MMVTRHNRPAASWMIGLMAGLLWLLIPWLAAWSHGDNPTAESPHPKAGERQLHVEVYQGRLSVDLRQADVAEVLALIGRQAGIPVNFGAGSGKSVSAQFTDLELDQGLRRLLRFASLSHAIRYSRGGAGAVTMEEVRVFEETKGEPPLPRGGARRDAAEREDKAGQHLAPPPAHAPSAIPPATGWEQSEAARHLHEVLEWAQQHGADPPPLTDPSDDVEPHSEGSEEVSAAQ
jgi:hypothetical protein